MSTLESRMQTLLKEANKRNVCVDITIAPTGSWMFLVNDTWVMNTLNFEEGITKLEERFGIEVNEGINRDEENAERWKRIREVAKDKRREATLGTKGGQPSILLAGQFGIPCSVQGDTYEETLTLAEEALGIKT